MVSNQAISVEVWGTGPTRFTHAFQAQGPDLVYAIARQPAAGTADVDAATGVLTYELQGNPASENDVVEVRVSNPKGSATASLQVSFRYDPLVPYQWHLKNSGQAVFSSGRPTAGTDINVHDAWRAGATGRGVLVNVIDTGLELAHEDLAANVLPQGSRNFLTGTTDPTPDPFSTLGDHGTTVAGIIGAQAFNNKGIRGVAPQVKLMGHNYLKSQSLVTFSQSFGGSTGDSAASADIFNASFGWSNCNWNSPSAGHDAVIANAMNLRAGKGAVVVKSAGNGFLSCDGQTERDCSRLGVSCFNANADVQVSTVHNAIVVGALDAAGIKASTASTGSNLWISAPGGQNGADSTVFGAADVHDRKPGIMTTDLSGCTRGFHTQRPYNYFEVDGPVRLRLNPDCNYTSTFSGTSAAAPSVSGVVALMLEARPDLSYRDVKHLLAITAARVDATRLANSSTSIFGSPFVLEQAWVTNAAGYSFHNWYGFGVVHASQAVQAARTHTLLPPQQEFDLTPSQATAQIPPASSTAWNMEFMATGQARTEVAELHLSVDRVSFKPSCAQVELLSPSGTRSILLNMKSAHSAAPSGGVMRFLSNAFYGEAMAGTWRMSIYNGCSAAMGLAAGVRPSLKIRGH